MSTKEAPTATTATIIASIALILGIAGVVIGSVALAGPKPPGSITLDELSPLVKSELAKTQNINGPQTTPGITTFAGAVVAQAFNGNILSVDEILPGAITRQPQKGILYGDIAGNMHYVSVGGGDVSFLPTSGGAVTGLVNFVLRTPTVNGQPVTLGVFSQGSASPILSNTTTITSLLNSTNFAGPVFPPFFQANTMRVGQSVRIRLFCSPFNLIGGNAFKIHLFINGVNQDGCTLNPGSTIASTLIIEFNFTVFSATTAVDINQMWSPSIGGTTAGISACGGGVTFPWDITQDNFVDVRGEFTTAAAGNNVTCQLATVETICPP